MTINTNFNVGDTIFFVRENEIIDALVKRIEITVTEVNSAPFTEVIYVANKYPYGDIKVPAGLAFATHDAVVNFLSTT